MTTEDAGKHYGWMQRHASTALRKSTLRRRQILPTSKRNQS